MCAVSVMAATRRNSWPKKKKQEGCRRPGCSVRVRQGPCVLPSCRASSGCQTARFASCQVPSNAVTAGAGYALHSLCEGLDETSSNRRHLLQAGMLAQGSVLFNTLHLCTTSCRARTLSCGHISASSPPDHAPHGQACSLSTLSSIPAHSPPPLICSPILAVQTSGPCPPARGVAMAILGRSCRASPPAPQPQFVRSLGPLRSLKSRLGARLPIRRIRVFCQVPPPSDACGPAVVEASMASAAVGWIPCETVPSLWRCSHLRSTALW